MMKKKGFTLSTLVLAVASLLTVPAFADTITLNLDSPAQPGTAGSTLSFDATVSAAINNLNTVYLNGDNFTLSSPLTLDDSGFFNGFPLSLNPGDLFSGLLFTVTLPSNVASGLYTGSFSILGGSTGDSQDVLATVNFNVNVPSTGPSPVPEPASGLLLVTGLLGLGAVVGKRVIA